MQTYTEGDTTMEIDHYAGAPVQGGAYYASGPTRPIGPIRIHVKPGSLIQASGSIGISNNGTDNPYVSAQIDVFADPSSTLADQNMMAVLGGTQGKNLTPIEHHLGIDRSGSTVWTGPETDLYVSMDVTEIFDRSGDIVRIEPYGQLTVDVTSPGADAIVNHPAPPQAQATLGTHAEAQDASGTVTWDGHVVGDPGQSWQQRAAFVDLDGTSHILFQTGYGTTTGNLWDYHLSAAGQLLSSQSFAYPGDGWSLVGAEHFTPGTAADLILQSSDTQKVWDWVYADGHIVKSTPVGDPGAGWGISSMDPGGIDLHNPASATPLWRWDMGPDGTITSSHADGGGR